MMLRPSSYQTLLALLLAGAAGSAVAQEGPLSAEERAAIEARIDTLGQELDSLRQRLAQDRLQSGERRLGLGEVITIASEQELEPMEERRQLERESSRNPFAITTHRRNYLLPLNYDRRPNEAVFGDVDRDGTPDRAEVKFQFSAKFNLIERLFGDYGGDLYFAYTQRSWWQAYNADSSSPFRETNYEPEVFIDFENRWSLLGWTNVNNRLSFNHQSNGRSGEMSRSWNRMILESTFVNDDWLVSVAPHWRIPESEGDDDNPDIERYMGYGTIGVARRFGDSEIGVEWHGNPSAGHMGTRVDYSWPLHGNIRGHVQYFYGYGDSMIDYDHRTQRIGIGFSLNPIFSGSSRLFPD
ncbi:phospholipase [Halomonas sp. MCCC 1A17488]|uniref:Phospholipase A1 n=1 Tax=Billgrantia sulfidoxydans TaxID=2733484 RepID=A0ABX7W259_9GAMM|nr:MULTISPECIES: phospholipase A [Halomonas]MCE8015745.1 phospholipase [Halomonas sp. MCCC 1A17488]MCG3239078.1 phospholipase [Halomonas sp. MCCC 1A17488]QPP50976.1 phospholipase A [Halomonas sp. SS10-MC5]QTP54489.1 phospholipase [Halomonas sulfidoxydans]